ncbi:flagellar motor switch protein FliM [Pseudomonas ogarae]|uniref:Flagellar motor switch protein FliM n=1 Tax=Pseudomonas ogarae (strain DSM 112162 / CECT 30235 / F113) TaxID=1114970 RepID=A0ABN5G6I0_PSEO1|nr:flagellar motor switch protein FliM [Pseudomonas ogarae]AEV60794.1 FliM2 [Pseudomonas ogarae]AUO44671.1 flagellar motor switch protein FliM [Pseudomonas ogarae]
MAIDDLLSQDEIDMLLRGGGDSDVSDVDKLKDAGVRPYDPATQHRVIHERLHALDIINERFARYFRMSLFNLIRRSIDITVTSVRYQSYSDFSLHMPMPTNINLLAMKPLRGTALVVFPPSVVFMVVDNLFGGDGRFVTKSEGREFTHTEQRIIRRLLGLSVDAYKDAWKSVYPLEIEYLRSEMQAKFANITSSPNEIVVNATFHLEVGNLSSDFNIVIPYLMIEPMRKLLTGPLTDVNPEEERDWNKRMAGEITHSEIELIADFVEMDARVGQVMALKVGDVLPIELPDIVSARVDGVPVMKCEYGSQNGLRALLVKELVDHSLSPASSSSTSRFIKGHVSTAKESDHD